MSLDEKIEMDGRVCYLQLLRHFGVSESKHNEKAAHGGAQQTL
jgi:hypothetical protein